MRKSNKEINVISTKMNLLLSLLMALVAAIFVLPVILVVSVSLSSRKSITANGYRFIPEEWSLEAYQYVYQAGQDVLQSFCMTVFYVVVGTVFSLFIMSMFAYVLSRKRFIFGRQLAFYTFFTTLFGGGLVPSYILYVRYLHIDDSIWVFILPGLVSAFNVIILRTFIQTTIPDSLEESARLDGASEWQIYCKIVLPLSKAGLATIGLFVVVAKWNEWFTGLMYVKQNRNLIPIMTYLQRIQKSLDLLKNNAELANSPEGQALLESLPGESTRMAITIISIFPLMISYPFFQKYFVKGLTVGSVKG